MLSSSLACLTCSLRPYMPCYLMHAYTCTSQRPWARSGRGLDEVWMRSGACLGHVWLVWVTSGSRLGRRLGLDPRVARPFNPESCMSSLGLIGLRSPKQISNLAYQVDGWSQAYEPTTAIIYSDIKISRPGNAHGSKFRSSSSLAARAFELVFVEFWCSIYICSSSSPALLVSLLHLSLL